MHGASFRYGVILLSGTAAHAPAAYHSSAARQRDAAGEHRRRNAIATPQLDCTSHADQTTLRAPGYSARRSLFRQCVIISSFFLTAPILATLRRSSRALR
jgi:hypothetical protein